ncbi:MAG: hydantoinase B/oxoprolinase family protein, partial [Nitrososphaerales archaeon]
LLTPAFYNEKLVGFAVSRAHHSDVGGASAGSMPIQAYEIFQEGLRIPPIKLVKRGKLQRDILEIILANVRTPIERSGDISAQIAANNLGCRRIKELIDKYDLHTLLEACENLLDYSERLMRKQIKNIPKGVFEAVDYLDDDGQGEEMIPIRVKVAVSDEEIEVDYTGTHKQVRGPLNAVEPVTLSATYYVIRTLTDPEAPINDGLYRPIKVKAPLGTIVNPLFPAAVAGGNVETSQRIVDALYLAFSKALPEKVPAASSGSMSNITIGGLDHRSGLGFAYYETIAGGSGAGADFDGENAIHTHMTNTMNTPVEALEHAYPITIEAYEVRRGSGGKGLHRGGDGVRRIYRIECEEAALTILSDRNKIRPWGLCGGEAAQAGRCIYVDRFGRSTVVPSKISLRVFRGDRFIVETPGGGGFGLT